tara:strand:+ start:152 stop:346 length:195 start_codon:yes stop_codon:yes gene_type:complete
MLKTKKEYIDVPIKLKITEHFIADIQYLLSGSNPNDHFLIIADAIQEKIKYWIEYEIKNESEVA